jgi:hypothetical protein
MRIKYKLKYNLKEKGEKHSLLWQELKSISTKNVNYSHLFTQMSVFFIHILSFCLFKIKVHLINPLVLYFIPMYFPSLLVHKDFLMLNKFLACQNLFSISYTGRLSQY